MTADYTEKHAQIDFILSRHGQYESHEQAGETRALRAYAKAHPEFELVVEYRPNLTGQPVYRGWGRSRRHVGWGGTIKVPSALILRRKEA